MREGEPRVAELTDEREPLAEAALQLIVDSIPARDRHPTGMLRNLLKDTREGATAARGAYHLLAVLDEAGRPLAAASGRYLRDSNTGFVMYLAVDAAHRGQGLGTRAREALVEAFREEAREGGHADLAAVVGEIAFDSPWLLALVRAGLVVPLDFAYYHPGMAPSWSDERYVLYRQPLADARTTLSAQEVRALLESVWTRGYGFRDPRTHEGYRAMLAQLEGRDAVGAHPEVLRLARGG